MASKIKVDQIQTADGTGTIALQNQLSGMTDASMPVGSIIQVVQHNITSAVTVANTTSKIIETSITTKRANSKILCMVNVSIGKVTSYTDDDLALAIGYKTASSSGSSNNYTAVHGNTYSREAVAGLGAFFAADTHQGGSTGDQYWVEEKSYNKLFTLSASASTDVYVSLWASSTSGTHYFGAPSGAAASDSGADTIITLMEIAV